LTAQYRLHCAWQDLHQYNLLTANCLATLLTVGFIVSHDIWPVNIHTEPAHHAHDQNGLSCRSKTAHIWTVVDVQKGPLKIQNGPQFNPKRPSPLLTVDKQWVNQAVWPRPPHWSPAQHLKVYRSAVHTNNGYERESRPFHDEPEAFISILISTTPMHLEPQHCWHVHSHCQESSTR